MHEIREHIADHDDEQQQDPLAWWWNDYECYGPFGSEQDAKQHLINMGAEYEGDIPFCTGDGQAWNDGGWGLGDRRFTIHVHEPLQPIDRLVA